MGDRAPCGDSPLTERSLLIVNYRSAALTAGAIASAVATSAAPLQVVVVDNSCDQEEAVRLAGLPIDELIIAGSNGGYAGGINLGIERCRGEFVMISNPDVKFRPEAIDRLIASVRAGAAMAGPKFVWDHEGEWTLPPASAPTLPDKLSEIVSQYSRRHAGNRNHDLLRERIRFWMLQESASTSALSGAVMCLRTADVRRFGGFDESFRLYFEEIDFMRKLQRSGRRLEYVPRAVCRHLYNQSAGLLDHSPANYHESELRYFEKWSGMMAVRLMALARRNPTEPAGAAPLPEDNAIVLGLPPDDVVVEASPLPSFVSAAGHFPAASRIVVPPEILSSYRSESLYLRVVRRDTLETVDSWVLRKVLK